MGIYEERPWLHLYAEGQPHDITPEYTDALAMFETSAPAQPRRGRDPLLQRPDHLPQSWTS